MQQQKQRFRYRQHHRFKKATTADGEKEEKEEEEDGDEEEQDEAELEVLRANEKNREEMQRTGSVSLRAVRAPPSIPGRTKRLQNDSLPHSAGKVFVFEP